MASKDHSSIAFAHKRLVQGLRGLFPGRAEIDVDRSVLAALTPTQYERFVQMSPFDQQHMCRVANYLRDHGVTDPDLIVAGLLHDIGKSDGIANVRLSDRVAKVLLKHAAPGVLQRVAVEYPDGRFRGLALTMLHPELGAEIARELGCSERTCWLVRNHEIDVDVIDPDLALLQAADFAS